MVLDIQISQPLPLAAFQWPPKPVSVSSKEGVPRVTKDGADASQRSTKVLAWQSGG